MTEEEIQAAAGYYTRSTLVEDRDDGHLTNDEAWMIGNSAGIDLGYLNQHFPSGKVTQRTEEEPPPPTTPRPPPGSFPGMDPDTIARLEELERFMSDMVDFEEFTTEAVAEALKELARFPEVFTRALDTSVGRALSEVGDTIFTAEELARDKALDEFAKGIKVLQGAYNETQERFDTETQEQQRNLSEYFENIARNIATQVGDLGGDIDNLGDNLSTRIVEAVAVPTDTAIQVLGETEGRINEKLDEQEGGILNTLGSAVDKIVGGVETARQSIETGVGAAFEAVSQSLGFAVSELTTGLTSALEPLGNLGATLSEGLSGGIETVLRALGLGPLIDLFAMFGGMLDAFPFNPSVAEDLGQLDSEWGSNLTPNQEMFAAIAAVPFLGQQQMLKRPGVIEKLRQANMALERPSILPVATLQEALRREIGSAQNWGAQLERHGFTDEDISSINLLSYVPLGVGQEVDLWLRDEITEEEVKGRLQRLGLNDTSANDLLKLSQVLPPVADLILFAIRGVFDLEESETFKEFEGLSPELVESFKRQFPQTGTGLEGSVTHFVREAKKLGLSDEWVAAYWASHWRLPSIGTAFEMYHRLQPDMVEHFSADLESAKLTPSEVAFGSHELDLLIRGADYSEFWREKLKAIAYKTLTRVDIRRMHKIKVFTTKEELIFQYRTLGYSPENAGLMADFTILYNAEPDKGASDEVRDLTKAEVLALVKGGQMTAEAAIEALQAIDYDVDAATAFVSLAEHQRAQKRLGDQIDIIKDMVRLGSLEYNDAIAALDSLDLEGMQRAEVSLEIDILSQKNIQHPSRGELDAFYEEGIISVDQYKTGLGVLGYSELWRERFAIQKSPTGEAVTVIYRYRSGQISPTQAYTELQRLEVPDRIARELVGMRVSPTAPVVEVETFEEEEL